MPMTTKSTKALALALGLVFAAGSLTGCTTTQEIDRTHRRPHTAMRGPAYKRLILTYNEANHLTYRADRYARKMRDAGNVDPDTQLRAMELADDLDKFTDDVEWSLTNLQRMPWHRKTMDKFWDRFEKLYPEDESFVHAYTSKDMRKVTPKLKLKNQAEYAQLHEYEHFNPNWGSIYGTGRVIYERQIEKQKQ